MGPYTEEKARMVGYYLDAERPGELEFIDRYAQKTGGPILELASGAARVTKELARRGHTVYGVEMSWPMLEKARQVVGKMDASVRDRIRLVRGDMANFSFGRTFPLIVIPFYSFWHNLEEAGPEKCVECMVEHTAPGGLFLVEGERGPSNGDCTTYGAGTELPNDEQFWHTMGARLGFQVRYERYAMDPQNPLARYHSFLIGERS